MLEEEHLDTIADRVRQRAADETGEKLDSAINDEKFDQSLEEGNELFKWIINIALGESDKLK